MKKLNKILKDLWTDESGAAATEYIFLLVIVVAIAGIFKDRISKAVTEKIDAVSTDINNFK